MTPARQCGLTVAEREAKVMMEIGAVSTALANVDLKSQIGTAVLGKAMDSEDALAAGLIEMIDTAAMERSVNPAVGGNIDLRI